MMLSRLPTALSLLLITTWVDAAPGFILPRSPAWSIPENAAPGEGFVPSNAKPLPAQICGIVGGYVLTVLIWGVLLLVVGRRMRRKTENSPKTLELELVTNRSFIRTPLSPASAKSTTSWSKRIFKKNPSINESVIGSPTSPAIHSPASFDHKVVEANRERAQLEMERLYAAVLDHDKKKSVQVSEQDATELQERRPPSSSGPAERRPSFNAGLADRRPSSNAGLSDRTPSASASMSERKPSGTSERRPSAINTRVARGEPPSNPASPMKAIYPPGYHSSTPTAPVPRDRLREQVPVSPRNVLPASPRSVLSKKSTASGGPSSSRSARFNLKNLRISGPIQKYPGTSANDEQRTPLSPRFYSPGAPPSPPTQQTSPTTPADAEAYERLDEVQPLPRPAPSRFNSANASSPTGRSATSSSGSLPLRGFSEPLKSPDIQTTYVDRRLQKLSLTTPQTSVPFTPYSPYMPFTPITPITPHLVTKKDRKMSKKVQGKKLATIDDMVQSPKEIFGDAW
ncbi:hypothetical protein BCR34DRAFT_579509 [Clohesyomyces aquaticus]|uniref:Uncharacterized protein n=1 Tax=Clohesyomyces aquaticus TaxID=1231657 RepID=A0A1Y1YAW1_9PLEO|nr:hypothetical protein BCR34DRAFT_579509 [Clohesyomyces aquaticus]